MTNKKISSGMVHKIPKDLRQKLISNPKALRTWEDITELARNEWVCWVESVVRVETRNKHIKIAVENLASGKRRPCCWGGCPHR